MKSILLFLLLFLIGRTLYAQPTPPEEKQKINTDAIRLNARIDAVFFQNKYDCDSALANDYCNTLYEKEYRIAAAAGQYTGAELYRTLFPAIMAYDSALDRYKTIAGSSLFLKRKIRQLNNIKPLEEKQKATLEKGFLSLSLINKDKSWADLFDQILPHVLKDTLYYAGIYKDEIARIARPIVVKEIKELMTTYKVTGDGLKDLIPLVNEKGRSIQLINWGYRESETEKDSLLSIAFEEYDSLIISQLIRDGTYTDNSMFATAVKYRSVLKLRETQRDSLLTAATNFQLIKKTNGGKTATGEKFDQKAYVSREIPRLLEEEQYNKLLVIANRDQANTWANSDWAELRTRGLTTDLDSAKVIKQILDFDLAQLIARTRYADDNVKLNDALKRVNETIPPPLSTLKAARNQTRVASTTSGTDLKW